MARQTNKGKRPQRWFTQDSPADATGQDGRPPSTYPVLGSVTADGSATPPTELAPTIPASEPPVADVARAAKLPTTALGGGSTAQVLKRYATDAVAVMFDCINQLREDADAARQLNDPRALAVAAMATKSAGSLAKDVVQFTVGHRLDVHVNIKSQEDVPRWEQLPVEVRAQFEETIGKLTNQAWEQPQ